MSFRGRGGGRGGGRGRGGGGRGGGRGGFNRNQDMGPPDTVLPLGNMAHVCQELLYFRKKCYESHDEIPILEKP